MKAVLANAVDSVASPIDDFTSDSEIVTGDLSNLKKSFDTRFVQFLCNVCNSPFFEW